MVQAVAIRLVLAALGVSTVLRSRMEVAAPPTNFNHMADAAFLHSSGTNAAELSPVSGLLLEFVQLTRAAMLPAVVLGAICDVISAKAVQLLAVNTGYSLLEAQNAALMYLWNPLSIVVCVSGSADPLWLAGIFAAAAAAAAGSPAAAGAAMAWAVHFSRTPQTILLAIPMVLLALKREKSVGKSRCVGKFVASLLTAVAALRLFADVFLFRGSLITAGKALHIRLINYSCGMLGLQCCMREGSLKFGPPLVSSGTSMAAAVAVDFGASSPPWSTFTPNVGLQWYLFAEIFPIFRSVAIN